MKRQAILKSTLCLLMAMMSHVAWANFGQKWTASPMGPWGTTRLTSYPEAVGAALNSVGGNVHMAEVKVTSTGGNVKVKFTYSASLARK